MRTTKMHKRVINSSQAAYVKKNKVWDDLTHHRNGLIQNLHTGQTAIVGIIESVLSDDKYAPFITQAEELIRSINLFRQDIAENTARLDAIYAKHSSRTGGTTDPDEFIQCIAINGEYADAADVYMSTVNPRITAISATLDKIVSDFNKAQSLKEEKNDPTAR